jgi:hypothetical protein
MTRLAAIHPEWANRDEPLGNDQTSAAGEVRTDDTKMVPPRWWPTAAPARKPEPPQIQPGQLGSGGQVKRAREAVEEVATTAQYLDHAGRDRAIRGKLTGDEPADARTRGEG